MDILDAARSFAPDLAGSVNAVLLEQARTGLFGENIWLREAGETPLQVLHRVFGASALRADDTGYILKDENGNFYKIMKAENTENGVRYEVQAIQPAEHIRMHYEMQTRQEQER